MAPGDLKNKTVIVTGGNAGIGYVTALALAKLHARVILACRDPERAEKARQQIVKDSKNENVVFKKLDLASLKSVRAFADDFNSTESHLHILVNNAGLLNFEDGRTTEDGFELHMGVNHLGHFLLTNLLLEKLKSSTPSRIVVVSSLLYKQQKVDFDNLTTSKQKGFAPYGRSKSANIMMAVKLAEKLKDTGVSVYSLHPGAVKTEINRDNIISTSCGTCCMHFLTCLICDKYKSPEEGAETSIFCATAPLEDLHNGGYYDNCREKSLKSHVTDKKRVDRLWSVSCEKVGIEDN